MKHGCSLNSHKQFHVCSTNKFKELIYMHVAIHHSITTYMNIFFYVCKVVMEFIPMRMSTVRFIGSIKKGSSGVCHKSKKNVILVILCFSIESSSCGNWWRDMWIHGSWHWQRLAIVIVKDDNE